MTDQRPRVCIFGDSHYACLKQADVQGLVDLSGLDLEYWGHVGGRFRHLEVRDGVIHPTDDFTARRFAKFNEQGRMVLPAADFDAILVMGARIYLSWAFLTIMPTICHGPFLSSGLLRRMLADRLRGLPGYVLAKGLAASGTAQVFVSPISFPVLNPDSIPPQISDTVLEHAADLRALLWDGFCELAAEDGITLLPQPEDTVVSACYTDPSYATANHIKRGDYEHKNAAYGARVLDQAMPLLREVRRRD